MKKLLTSFVFILFLSSVFLSMEGSGPENIVILICDGMGFNHLYLSELVTGKSHGKPQSLVSSAETRL